MDVLIPALTSLLAAIMAVALADQWRRRRQPYQLVWCVGMTAFAVAAGCEAIAAAAGWSEPLYRVWYLTGAVWTAGWLGLGNAFLLGRTRFGYGFALCLFFAGLFTFLTPRRFPAEYGDVGIVPLVYFIVAGALAFAVAVATWLGDDRWPRLAAIAVVGASLLSIVLMVGTTLPAPGYSIDPATGAPTGAILPGELRLLTPFLNVTGAFALILGALFSAWMFMPKKRILPYSLDPDQPGEQFLFQLILSPFALVVDFVVSLPGAIRALFAGRLHSRVPATILLALGGLVPTITDSLNRFGSTELYALGKLIGVVLLLAGFLVSTETFTEVRVPFTGIVLRTRRGEQHPT
ncbi:MAG: hypothetical protein KF809_14080 [Chloroflexi bacterium]|nr:hypothetical protein [Chloroflexota bacterium]